MQDTKSERYKKSWQQTQQQTTIILCKPITFAPKTIQHTSVAVNCVQILDSDVHDLEAQTEKFHSAAQCSNNCYKGTAYIGSDCIDLSTQFQIKTQALS